MNPYVIIVGVLACIGAFFYGTKVGKDGEIAAQAETRDLINKVKEDAQQGAAVAIRDNRPKHVTIQQRAETVIRESKILTECVNPPELKQLLDDARRDGQDGTIPAGSSLLPAGLGNGESR